MRRPRAERPAAAAQNGGSMAQWTQWNRWEWTKRAQGFLLFISGVIASVIVSAVLGHIIPVSEALLMALLVLALLGAAFFVAGSARRIEALADRMETTVRYVEEPYREQEGVPFEGLVYRELERLLSDARTEILVVATSSPQDTAYATREHPARTLLLDMVEERIARRGQGGCKYVYLAQRPREGQTEPLVRAVRTATAEHFRRILDMERHSTSPQLELGVVQIVTQRLTDFVLIDRRQLVLVIDGVDSAGSPYAAGAFIMEDRGGRMVEHLLWNFERLERAATAITLADLTPTSAS